MATRMAETPEGQRLAAILGLARSEPKTYVNSIVAFVDGDSVHLHPFQDLLYESLNLCLQAGKHCVLVMPPEHIKTTGVARWSVWQRAKNPRLRIGLTSGDEGRAKKTLTAIRKIILSSFNQIIFPHMRPDASRSQARGEWNQTRLYLDGDSTDPSFEVYPFEGEAGGARLDILIMDDVIGASCRTSEADRTRTYGLIHGQWLNRLTGEGIAIVLNNVWHREDAVHKMALSPSFHTFWMGYRGTESIYWRCHHPVSGWMHGEAGEFGLWEAVWPESRLINRDNADHFAYKRMFGGKAMLAEECRFPPMGQWARWSDEDVAKVQFNGGYLYATLDPAGGKFVKKGDFAAIAVVMIGRDRFLYVIDVWMGRELPQRQIERLWEIHEKWADWGGLRHASIEVLPKDDGFVVPVVRAHQDKLREAGREEWKMSWDVHGAWENKITRIDGSVRYFTNGWIKWPHDLERRVKAGAGWREMVNQLEDFPLADHDDGPDSLAAAIELAVKRGPMLELTRDGRLAQDRANLERYLLEERKNNRFDPVEYDEWGRVVKKAEAGAWAL